jgi:hypothetical protein
MQWMKQVFAQRYNAAAGRVGHIWGDRYWSRIVEEGEVGGEADNESVPGRESSSGVCPHYPPLPAPLRPPLSATNTGPPKYAPPAPPPRCTAGQIPASSTA